MFKVPAALVKRVSCIKRANKINLNKSPFFQREKEHLKDLSVTYYKLSVAENVTVSLQRQ